MKTTNEKTTIYLNPRIKKSVQHYALRDSRSLSEIINEKLFEYLEDMADRTALSKARKESDEFVTLDQMVHELGLDLNEIRGHAQTERQKTVKKD